MKKLLKNEKQEVYHYKEGKKIIGVHERISGNVSDISGNIDACEITEKERKRGIKIEELVKIS